ncbi:MAG TPA: hypothetical protein V6C89_06755 [Drouetiella sp.]|jgi:hypothetical protein
MQSLLVVILLTIACSLLPPCAYAQNQQRWVQARNQIAYNAPSASQIVSSQYNFDYSPFTQGDTTSGASNVSNNAAAQSSIGDPWTAQQNGVASAYNYSNSTANQGGNATVASGRNSAGDTYAMSQADVLAARRAMLSGSFFSYHGTQSSQSTRNR